MIIIQVHAYVIEISIMSNCGISLRRPPSHLQLKRLMLYKLLNGYFSHDNHCSKCFSGTASTTIGIKL